MILIKRKLTNSHEQLGKDFEEFPLSCFVESNESDIQFYVVQTSPLNRKFYDWLSIARGVRNGDIEELSDFGSGLKRSMMSSVESFKDLVVEFRNYSKSVPVFFRIFVCLLFLAIAIVVVPLLSIAILAIVIYRGVPALSKSTQSTGSLGYSSPIKYNGKSEIVVASRFVQGRLQEPDIAIVTHEHIHLLQHHKFPSEKMSSRNNGAFDGDKKDSLASILENPAEHIDKACYYFLLDEMEARLHEIVLSYYRKNKLLPQSLDEYVEMLLGIQSEGQMLGSLVACSLEDREEATIAVVEPYIVRCQQIQSEFVHFLLWLKDDVTRKRYILEVLSVMYANLLVIYGYQKESCIFLGTFQCRDLYNELYGLPGTTLE